MYRTENDLIGNMQVPSDAYYGVHTQRAMNNFHISGVTLSDYPNFVKALAYVKWGAAKTNCELGILDKDMEQHIIKACQRIIAGEFLNQFPSDMIQGGAGTSTNMNINEVVANIVLESVGRPKGDYEFCSPHDHVNLSQSTNDSYPTAVKLAILFSNDELLPILQKLAEAFDKKAKEFAHVLKMGRTQLQDAVPMTLGQEFEGYAITLKKEIKSLNDACESLLEINMGATAIGTGLNAVPGYAKLCAENIASITKKKVFCAENLVEDTPSTEGMVVYSSALRKLAIKLSKVCNDLRLLTSGPRCGLYEIKLPAMQAGSSIMPGKVNPVIPEVVNQTCFKVIGNDLMVTLGSEAAQLELNVMEPVMTYSILESIKLLCHAMDCLRVNCIEGIQANEEHCKKMVLNSIGIVTALNPHIGYEHSTAIAKEALETGRSVYDLVLEKKVLTKEKLDKILNPENMLGPSK